jgi:hypothetical protein
MQGAILACKIARRIWEKYIESQDEKRTNAYTFV